MKPAKETKRGTKTTFRRNSQGGRRRSRQSLSGEIVLHAIRKTAAVIDLTSRCCLVVLRASPTERRWQLPPLPLPVASRGKRSLKGGSGTPSEPKRRASTAKWTAEEDAQLCSIVQAHSAKDWRAIASHLPGRTDVQCLHRWKKVLRPGLKKGELRFVGNMYV